MLMHALAASCEELRARTGNPPLHCDSVLNEMADMYIQGDTKQKLKRHNVPVYRDARSTRLQNGYSKVLNRIASSPNPFPFLS